jgi:segregation and condensation protein B
MEDKNIVNVIEAVLFALGREIQVDELSSTLAIDKEEVLKAIQLLEEKYTKDTGVMLVKVNNMYQLVTNKVYYPEVNKFIENTKRKNLSTTVLETLSIIAYNPKITKSEIEGIRGVNSDFAVNRLLECGLVEEVARLNLPGRPAAYAVTNEFLKSCGIDNVSKLPDFENIKIKNEQMLVSDFEVEEDKETLEEQEN